MLNWQESHDTRGLHSYGTRAKRSSAGARRQEPYVLLLVCTRGIALPSGWDDLHSVQRVAATADDAKPESFRQLIEAIAIEGRRLELFARREVPGWDAWPTDEQGEAYQRACNERGMVLEIGASEG